MWVVDSTYARDIQVARSQLHLAGSPYHAAAPGGDARPHAFCRLVLSERVLQTHLIIHMEISDSQA